MLTDVKLWKGWREAVLGPPQTSQAECEAGRVFLPAGAEKNEGCPAFEQARYQPNRAEAEKHAQVFRGKPAEKPPDAFRVPASMGIRVSKFSGVCSELPSSELSRQLSSLVGESTCEHQIPAPDLLLRLAHESLC